MTYSKTQNTYLVVTPFFPNNRFFSGGEYVYDQVEAIQRNSVYKVNIVKIASFFSKEVSYRYKGYNIHVFRCLDFPFFIFPGFFSWINRIRFYYFLQKNKLLTHIKVIHAHVNYPAGDLSSFIAEKCDIISIMQHHGLDPIQLMNGRVKFFNLLYRNILIYRSITNLNKMSVNVGVSQLVLNKLYKFKRYKPKKELVLYNGIDRTKFYPLAENKEKRFIIGCIANFWKIKDQITLIKAIKKLNKDYNIRDIYVEFIGSGAELDMCKRYVKANNLDSFIIFLPEIEHHKLNDYYNYWSLFVLPSYYEAFGCVFLESWAANTPFMAVRGQGIEEIIDNNYHSSHLFKKGDYVELSEKILLFYKKELGLQGLNVNIDINKLMSKFLSNINSL